MKFESTNDLETQNIAAQLAKYLFPGMTILLEGDLGAGKTTFTKGLAKGLGINQMIKSPTYTIIREYESGKMPLYHIDLYRLSPESVEELYLEDYFEGEGIVVVEWGSVAPEFLPPEYLKIMIDRKVGDLRELTLLPVGLSYETLLEDFGN